MEQAKHAVSDFLSKGGQRNTTVHESVAPSVQDETIRQHQREEQQVVKDREIHQDHYHTTVQPVKDREVLPEQHHHNLAATEHRTFDHRNESDTHERLQHEHSKFKNRTVHETSDHTTATAKPEVGSDRVHHHVHEVVQPVIHKETIDPHVVHTTVPIHETHYNAPKHHTSTELPAVNMSDFQKQGGSMTGRDERVHHFSGEPEKHHFDASRDLTDNKHGHHTQGVDASRGGLHTDNKHGHHVQGVDATRGGLHADNSLSHQKKDSATDIAANPATKHSTNTSSLDSKHAAHDTAATTHKKPSLLDKLNPMKDADGDGKKGFMD